MSGTIESRLRITAETAQAVGAMRQLKKEKDALVQPSGTAGKTVFTEVTAGAGEASAKTKAARAELEAYRAAQKAARDEERAARLKQQADDKAERDRIRDAKRAEADAAREANRAIRQARQEARQLAPQLTDIVVGLSTGQSPFQVLLQQGGQLKDVFGGVGNAAKALAAIFTPVRVIVGGLAAAIGTVVFQAFAGVQESDALRKSLALTGNVADTSAGQLDAMARRIAGSQKVAIGAVRETLAAAVESGAFTGVTLDSAGRAATALSKLSGKTAADTVKDFAEMGSGVAAWAAKSNASYNFLTADQYKYIRSLEAQGRTQEAMRVTLDALASTMESRSAPALGTLERTWNAVGAAVSGVLDKLKAIGRDTTAEEKIAALQKKLETAQAASGLGARGGRRQATTDAAIAGIQAEIEIAQKELARQVERENAKANAAKAAQAEIKQSSKSFQDSLAQIDQAGAQKALAQRLAALDREQQAVDAARAQGLTSELAHNLALNKIDQQRLAAQEAALQRQLAIERGRVEEKPEDKTAKQAAVTAVEAQLVELRSRIGQEVAKGRNLVEADALASARDNSQQWATAWTNAFQQVRAFTQQNAATRALAGGDPDTRAAAEASAKTAAVRQQLADLQRDLNLRLSLTVDPAQRAELKQQIEALARESQQAIDEQTRGARFASFQAQLGELQAALALREQQITLAVEQEAITTEEAERRKIAARAESLPQLDAILAKMREIASTPAERATTERSAVEVEKTRIALTSLELTARGAAKGGLAQMFTDISTGAKTGKEALEDMVGGFTTAMLNVLNQRLAERLVGQFADAATGAGGGTNWLSEAFTFASSFFHTGGVVGSGGAASRAVHPAAWALAPRYHGGGTVGLKPRERAIVALDGEEVLTEDNPRHVKNFRGGLGGVQIGVSVTGAQGSSEQQAAAGFDLGRMVTAAIEQWAAKESRAGGILAGSR